MNIIRGLFFLSGFGMISLGMLITLSSPFCNIGNGRGFAKQLALGLVITYGGCTVVAIFSAPVT